MKLPDKLDLEPQLGDELDETIQQAHRTQDIFAACSVLRDAKDLVENCLRVLMT